MTQRLRSIRGKIISGFLGVTLLFVAAIAGSSLVQTKVTMTTDEVNRQLDQLSSFQYMTNLVRQVDDHAVRYLLTGGEEERATYDSSVERMSSFFDMYKSDESLTTSELAAVEELEQNWQTYLDQLTAAIDSYSASGEASAETLLAQMSADDVLASLDELQGTLKTEIDTKQANIETYRSFTMIASLSITAAAIVAAIIIAFGLTKRITKPIQLVGRQLKQIAEGDADLSQRLSVKSKDEVGEMAQHFNQMLEKLGGMITSISVTSEQITDSSGRLKESAKTTREASESITGTMREVAIGTDKQVEDLSRNVQAVAEIALGIGHIAQNMEAVTGHSIQSANLAGDGKANVEAVVRQMTTIHESIQALSGVINGFVDRSKDIRQIMNEMSEIATQTNLLALNASIEAARAGDQGRGFAVVAGEVKKLAERSTQSAERVQERVMAMQSEAAHASSVMDASWQQVEQGMTIAKDAGHSFTNIQQAIDEVSGQIQQVSAAIEEITASTEEISDSMKMVASISSQTASGAEFVSDAAVKQKQSVVDFEASADDLAVMAAELQRALGQLRT
ncbi:methyl-accepting chemotaxis protein [Paenibacillus phyllosphaerae]|uniref:Methyl-accepting chemotaxis protein n=1 Tax=Paenibacillus phyllosphaerae TaxID=274593 RepID=A0A7W5FL96_9BACL|nr:methyl-accepting chemotaxis protein [Paenibacillus phyllosphaerae]MBB3108762.1 methyl-accepting chemotaxis protein [Paenibacillus phyllosphaerae]